MKVSLFIPFKNEIVGLKAVIPQIDKSWVDEFVFIDGNSNDGSVEYINSLGYSVIPQSKPGLLNAWWEGFDNCHGDIIIPFSPDNNSVAADIPILINKMKEGFDIVIASRYAKGATSYDDNLTSGLANKWFTGIINFLFFSKYTDSLTMYKAFKTSLLKELNLDQNRADHFEVLLACRAAKRKLKITEIPSDEPSRLDGGESRAHPGRFGKVKSAFQFLYIILRERITL
jgi:glycosyltransferase involved in cell wall biosynthesis